MRRSRGCPRSRYAPAPPLRLEVPRNAVFSCGSDENLLNIHEIIDRSLIWKHTAPSLSKRDFCEKSRDLRFCHTPREIGPLFGKHSSLGFGNEPLPGRKWSGGQLRRYFLIGSRSLSFGWKVFAPRVPVGKLYDIISCLPARCLSPETAADRSLQFCICPIAFTGKLINPSCYPPNPGLVKW